MEKTIQAILSPEVAYQPELLAQAIRKKARLSDEEGEVRLVRRSVDARGKQVKINVQALVTSRDKMPPLISYRKDFANVSQSKPVVIVGFGPAGMFAALRLIELGYQPIVIERGSDVRKRRRDIAAINKDHVVNPESNYCFGEGGAGTYSDGKLYTRSKKRGDIQKSLEILVAHGAPEDILIDAHPQMKVRLRFHPHAQYGATIRDWFDGTGVEFSAPGVSLKEDLADVALLLTGWSSVFVESLYYGTPVVFFGAHDERVLAAAGDAIPLAEDAAELQRLLAELLSADAYRKLRSRQDAFFRTFFPLDGAERIASDFSSRVNEASGRDVL